MPTSSDGLVPSDTHVICVITVPCKNMHCCIFTVSLRWDDLDLRLKYYILAAKVQRVVTCNNNCIGPQTVRRNVRWLRLRMYSVVGQKDTRRIHYAYCYEARIITAWIPLLRSIHE